MTRVFIIIIISIEKQNGIFLLNAKIVGNT